MRRGKRATFGTTTDHGLRRTDTAGLMGNVMSVEENIAGQTMRSVTKESGMKLCEEKYLDTMGLL